MASSLMDNPVHHPDVASEIHPAHLNAKRQLVNHIYKDLFTFPSSGATRKEIIGIAHELLESMKYDEH